MNFSRDAIRHLAKQQKLNLSEEQITELFFKAQSLRRKSTAVQIKEMLNYFEVVIDDAEKKNIENSIGMGENPPSL